MTAHRRLQRAQARRPPCHGGPPVYLGDFPDPHIVRVGASFYAYGTQAGGLNVPVLRSGDLTRWELLGDAVPELHAWAAPGATWSPAVLARGDRFVMYHTVREPRSGRQAIAVAASAQPEGPYVDVAGGPFVFQEERGGSIDPSPFVDVDVDGQAYLVWKSDDNALDRSSSLWGQRLSEDGCRLLGDPTELLRRDRRWERPLIEAPCLVRAGAAYYLFYSANWWESDRYCIGYAVAASPLGPYLKVTTTGPWLVSGPDAAGPGGQEIFADVHGRLHMAFHAWTPGAPCYSAGGARSLRIAGIRFDDGLPVVEALR